MLILEEKKGWDENEDGRQISLGLLQTMTALQPQFHDVTLACDDILTIQTHKAMLEDISTVSTILLRKYPNPYPLVYLRGEGDQHQVGGREMIEDRP